MYKKFKIDLLNFIIIVFFVFFSFSMCLNNLNVSYSNNLIKKYLKYKYSLKRNVDKN